jgi:hypothetical protein
LDFHLFEPLKQHLGGRRFLGNEEAEMAVSEWLRMKEPDLYRDGNFELVPRRESASMCSGIMSEK